jgi:hypothetical protein
MRGGVLGRHCRCGAEAHERCRLRSDPEHPAPRPDGRCAPVAGGGCVRCTRDVGAGSRASTRRAAHPRRAAHAPGSHGSPDPSGACDASSVVAARAGSPDGYRSAVRELVDAGENRPRRLHTPGAAWLHPRNGSTRHAMRAPIPAEDQVPGPWRRPLCSPRLLVINGPTATRSAAARRQKRWLSPRPTHCVVGQIRTSSLGQKV